MSPSEARFHEAMLDVYRNARQRCKYNATYFLQMVSEIGGLATARKLLQRSEPSSGFAERWLCGAGGLAVEASCWTRRLTLSLTGSGGILTIYIHQWLNTTGVAGCWPSRERVVLRFGLTNCHNQTIRVAKT